MVGLNFPVINFLSEESSLSAIVRETISLQQVQLSLMSEVESFVIQTNLNG